MLVNIEIIEKPEIYTQASFELEHFKSDKDYKEAMAIIFMISADYYLDPELGPEDLQELVVQGREKSKVKMALQASEDGLELEFLD